MTPEAAERRVAAILCFDAGRDAASATGDDMATARSPDLERADSLVRRLGGRSATTPGDGLLAEFPSAVDAVVCAVEIQRDLARLPAERSPRIGIHVGDVVAHGDRIAGEGVEVASRIGRLVEPGGVCVAAAVFEQVRDRLSCAFDDLGEHALEGIPKPLRVYRVEPAAPAATERARAAVPRWMAWVALAALAASGVVSAWLILAEG